MASVAGVGGVRRPAREAAVIGLSYAMLASLYIVLSDTLIGELATAPEALVQVGMLKGLAFVLTTSLGLYGAWLYLAGRAQRERSGRLTALRRIDEISDALPSPLLVHAADGRILGWNAALEASTGHSASRLATMRFQDLLHPEDAAAAFGAISRVLHTGRPDSTDLRLMTADGSPLLHRWHGAPLRDADGRIESLLTVGIDLNDRQKVQEELQRALLRSRETLRQTVEALTTAIEKRGAFTAGHERRVAALALAIADELGLDGDRREGLEHAALLHDIGELAVPPDILVRPGRLSGSELAIIRTHPGHGHEILRDVDFPWPVAEIVRQHHERLDGSGYPLGLRGDDILLEARIIAVADVVEAMCSHRPYRPALGMPAALAELRDGRGRRYDAAVVDACLTVCRDGFGFPEMSA